jgi:hypothetical protein
VMDLWFAGKSPSSLCLRGQLLTNAAGEVGKGVGEVFKEARKSGYAIRIMPITK